MGQAVADLPNPLDAAPPTSVSGADDLLAQLAGDEIDRLLAEADVSRPAPAVETASAPATPAAQDSPVNPAASAPPAEQPSASAPSVPETDELDKLLNELSPEPVPEQSKSAALTEQVSDVLAAAGVNAPAELQNESLEGVMSPAEREALNLANLEAATTAAEQQDAAVAAVSATAPAAELAPAQVQETAPEVAVSARSNIAVRILEWINAPLSFVPDAGRDALGKAAIVTIVNSLAVLVYVIFFRHGH